MRPSRVFSDGSVAQLFAPLLATPSFAMAVSGGPDSMALMVLCRRWCELSGRRPGAISVLTVDHGLRAESAAEAEFVRRTANELGYDAEVLVWEGSKRAGRLQETARKARYALMTGYCRARDLTHLLLAHTEDDQAETLVMRLARGSGLDGLSSMARETERDGVLLLRPLLHVTKARLTAYLREQNRHFIRDPSNENLAFERPRIRPVMKALKGLGVSPHALGLSALRLGRAREALALSTCKFLQAHFTVSPLGDGSIEREAFDRETEEIAIRALGQALMLVGGRNELPRLAKAERCVALRSSPRFEVSLHGCLVSGSAARLRLVRETGRMAIAHGVPKPGEPRIWDGRFVVTVSPDAPPNARIEPLHVAGWNACLDAPGHSRLPIRHNRAAALSTPALWQDCSLLCAPLLGWSRNTGPAKEAWLRAVLVPQLACFIKPTQDPPAAMLGK